MTRWIIILVLAASLHACKKDEPAVSGMSLISISVGTIDLRSVWPAGFVPGVPIANNIVVTFSNDIDFQSISDTTVLLHRDTTNLKLNYVVAGKTLTIVPVVPLLAGTFLDLKLTNRIRSVNGYTFDGFTVRFQTAGIGVDTPPRAAFQLMYIPFSGSAADVTLRDSVKVAKLTFGVDRFGIGNAAGDFGGTVNGGGTGDNVQLKGDTLITPSMSVSFWISISRVSFQNSASSVPVFGYGAEKGYYFEIGADPVLGPVSISFATNHTFGATFKQIKSTYSNVSTDPLNPINKVGEYLTDGWHHVALTFDAATTRKAMYIDGKLIQAWILSDDVPGVGGMALDGVDTTLFSLGYYCSAEFTGSKDFYFPTSLTTFVGSLDDFRLFKTSLSANGVDSLATKEAPPK